MPRWLCCCLLVLLCLPLKAESQTVRLITIGPGDAFWSVYGHTALAIDQQVYAFGYFDFSEENLFKAFLLNDMNYAMGISELSDELYWARHSERQFTEQVLDLPPAAVRQLKQQLDWHYLPENRRYQYDYFANNCATKVRDFLNQATEGALYQKAQILSPYSYADLTLPTHQQSAMRFGLAVGYGYQAYETISYWQAMAFPLVIEDFLRQHMTGWLAGESVLYQPPTGSWDLLYDHSFYLILLSILVLGWLIRPLRRHVINVWFCLAGFVGVVILVLWFVMPHPVADGNFNLLLFNPVLFLAVVLKRTQAVHLLLMVCLLLWLGFAGYWGAWYLLPLMMVQLLYLVSGWLQIRTA